MQGYVGPIEALIEGNRDFRRGLFTAGHMQVVLMALQPGEEIGSEIPATHDQFFRIEKGQGEIRLDGVRSRIGPGDAIIVPAGMRHNLINTGKRRLRLNTLYAPPQHVDRLVEVTKAEADRHEAERQAQVPADKERKAEPGTGALATGSSK